MSPDEIWSVQDTFGAVAAQSEKVADLFYARLFEVAPEVRPLFRNDMKAQGMKLMSALTLVVQSLGHIESILPVARKLATDHVSYGVEARHYAIVGEALLWTLEKGLAGAFTDDVKEAWRKAYDLLSSSMIETAYPTRKA
jgi:nitric oxide dioxygenase